MTTDGSVRQLPRRLVQRLIAATSDKVASQLIRVGLADSVDRLLAERTASSRPVQHSDIAAYVESLAFRAASEVLLARPTDLSPNALFSGISDAYWYWLCTEGYRTFRQLKHLLPPMPDEHVQWSFTGKTGDVVLREGYLHYQLFRNLYEEHVGPIESAERILDFGCGWGRIIRFFLKDVDPTRLWGIDPVDEMIAFCQRSRWSNFKTIRTNPPSPFQDNTFDLIYAFSVFSHLSEEMHNRWLQELARILKPNGLLIVTTREREFIEYCAVLRNRPDLETIHPGPRSSAASFIDTRQCLEDYDNGRYCFTQLVHEGEWEYWGDAAISKSYVLKNWTKVLEFVDYIDDRSRYEQNVIVMKKLADDVAVQMHQPPVGHRYTK